MKQPPLQHEMTDDEVQNRRAVLEKKTSWHKKWALRLAIGAGMLGIGIAVAAAAGIALLPLAPMTIVGLTGAIVPTAWGISNVNDGACQRELTNLKQEADRRAWVAPRVQENVRRAEEKKERVRLREEFEGSLLAMSEGNGTNKDMKVGRALRFRAKAMFGALAT